MRVIKFRAWSDKNKKMLYLDDKSDKFYIGAFLLWGSKVRIGKEFGNYWKLGNAGHEWEIFGASNSIDGNQSKDFLMQSIGARDVNYKDIYEGDLVRFNHREGYSEVFEVVYLDEYNECEYPTNPLMCCYILFNRKTKNWMDFQWDDTDDMEVIGNIYENPKLLESEK